MCAIAFYSVVIVRINLALWLLYEHIYSPTRQKDRQSNSYIQWRIKATIYE